MLVVDRANFSELSVQGVEEIQVKIALRGQTVLPEEGVRHRG